jgi:hypothetical protein
MRRRRKGNALLAKCEAGNNPAALLTFKRVAGARLGRKRHNALEKAIIKLCTQYLKVPAWKTDAGALLTATGLRCNVESGTPDISGIIPPTGRAFFIEVKTGSGRARKNQREKAAELMAAGAAVYVVHDITEAENFVRLLLAGEKRKHELLMSHNETETK